MNNLKYFIVILVSVHGIYSYGSDLFRSSSAHATSASTYSLNDIQQIFLSPSQNLKKEAAIQSFVLQAIPQQNLFVTGSDLDHMRQHDTQRWDRYMNSYRDEHGQTLLMHAVIASNTVMIDFLRRSNVDINAQDFDKKTALHKAVDIADEQKRITPLFPTKSLISYFVVTSLEHLSEYQNMNANSKDIHGATALDIALSLVLKGKLDATVVFFLVENLKMSVKFTHEVYLEIRTRALKQDQHAIVQLLDSQNHVPNYAPIPNLVTIPEDEDYVQIPSGQRVRSHSENDKFYEKPIHQLMNHRDFSGAKSMHYPVKIPSYMPASHDLKQQYTSMKNYKKA